MYDKPIPCDYYGLTLWMRMEYRGDGNYQTVILSDRGGQAKRSHKMVYEHPPRTRGAYLCACDEKSIHNCLQSKCR